MAKLAALLAAFLLVAHVASAFRTTITIDEAGEDNRRGGRCSEQMEQVDLSHCMRYMKEQQMGRREYVDTGRESQYKTECCNELRRIPTDECRCEGLQMEMQREMRPQDMRQMKYTAQMLPNMCGVGPSMCRFDMPSFY